MTRTIKIVALAVMLFNIAPASGQELQYATKKPGGCWHYGYYYNPRADYGPYYNGHPRPVLRATERLLFGVPYPGYYHGPRPY